MFSGRARWAWLTFLALCNLLLWVAIAGVMGLCAGQGVDLGVESWMRQRQATVVVVWEQAAASTSAKTARPAGAGPEEVAPATAGLAAVWRAPATATPLATRPASTSVPSATPPATMTATAAPGAIPQDQVRVENPPAATRQPASPTAAADPQEALVNSPLLLADPQFQSLAGMDAEMARSAQGRPVQIRYQEAALNREIAALWQNNPDLPYRDVSLDLKRDQVVISGKVTVLGFEVKAQVEGTVVARDCVPQIEIQTISIAGVMTPRFVRDQVEDMVLDAMAWYPADYPLCLEQIVLEETRATVYGYHR